MGDALYEAAQWALIHMEAEDTANAGANCSPVRYRPLTQRLAQALHDATPEGDMEHDVTARVMRSIEQA